MLMTPNKKKGPKFCTRNNPQESSSSKIGKTKDKTNKITYNDK